MAQRFESIFYDVDGIRWRLAIDDDNHTGSSTPIRLTGQGFVTTWEGSETTPFCGIMPSSTTIEVANEGGDFATFLSEIANKSEGDVRVRIYDNQTPSTTQSNDLWWAGVVLIDGIQQEDRPAPTTVTLQAIDDLATLKGVRWDSDLPDGYPAQPATSPGGIATILLRSLHRARNFQCLGSSAPLLRTVLDFQLKGYDEQQFGISYPGPKILEQVTAGIGFAENEFDPVDGSRPRWFIWDILQSLAVTFNARLFWARGCWNFWPVNVHFMDAEGAVAEGEVNWADRVYGYTVTGADMAFPSGAVGQLAKLKRYHLPGIQMGLNVSSETHPERDALTKINGGLKTYTTPVKYVKRQQDWSHTYAIGSESYILNGSQFASVQGNGTDPDHYLNNMNRLERMNLDDDRTFFAGAEFQLNLSGNFSRPANSYPGTGNTCRVKIHIVWDVGPYRWKGADTGWSTDQTGDVSWYMGQGSFSEGINIPLSMEHQTAGHPLPADSDGMTLVVSFTLHNAYGGDITSNLVTGTEASQQTSYLTTVLQSFFLNGENTDQLHFIAETSRSNTVTLDQGTTLFGTTPGSFIDTGHIVKLPSPFGPLAGYSWMDDDKWGSWHDPDQDVNINRLGVNEIAGMLEVGREVESGELKLSSDCNPLTPLNTLRTRDVIGGTYDQDYWAPLTITYNAGTRTANVTRIRLDWDGALNNVTNPTDDEGSNTDTNTGGDPSTVGDTDNDPVGPNTGGGSGSGGGSGGGFPNTATPIGKLTQGKGDGKQLNEILDKVKPITVDPGNGITSLQIKSGEQPIGVDAIETTPDKTFIADTERTKLGNITYAGGGIDLDAVATKTGHITADSGGISVMTFKANTTPISVDAVATTSSKRFLSDANLQAIADNETRSTNAENKTDLLTVTAATDLDTVRTKADHLTVTAATDLDTVRTKAGHISATSNGITGVQVSLGSQPFPISAINETGSSRKFADQSQLDKVDQLNGGTSGIRAINVESGYKPLTADQVNDSSTTAKFTTAAGVQKLGHITANANGISSLTTADGSLSLTDAVAFFDGSTGTALGSRSGANSQRVATIETDGGLGEIAAGSKGQYLQSGGANQDPAWAGITMTIASLSARVTTTTTGGYYYGSSAFGWAYPIWSGLTFNNQQGNPYALNIADDYAHMGIVAPRTFSTLKLIGTIRNDNSSDNLEVFLGKTDRPDGSSSNMVLTELGTASITVTQDRHQSVDLTTTAGVASGQLLFIGIRRVAGTSTRYVNFSLTLNGTT